MLDGQVQPATTRPADGGARPIFVVDDDASVRDSLSELLRVLGFEVIACASGSQLLADQRRREAGCLVVDQHMPGMDGLATLSALRRDGTNAPAILITGRLDPEIAARAAALGISALLEKPFAVPRLVELVQASVSRT